MADTLKSKISTTTTTVKPGIQDEARRLQSSQDYLDEYKQLVVDPQYKATVPEDTRQTLKEAIGQAESMYQKRANTNDWLEVAQTLGQAVAQFAGASAGQKSGRDMSNLNMGPKIDYSGRSDRAFREYQQAVRNIGDTATLDRQAYLDSSKAKEKEFDEKKDYLKTGVTTAAHRENTNRQITKVEQTDEKRKREADAKEAAELRRLNLRDLEGKEKSLSEQLRAGQSLATQLQQESDLSKKGAEKMQSKYGSLAGQAGVDLYGALETFDQTAPREKPGFVGGMFGSKGSIDKPKANKSLLDALGLTEKLEELKRVRARKAELLTAAPKAEPAAAPTEASAPPPVTTGPKTVKMKGPSGQVAEMTEEASKKYIGKPGYEIVQ